MPIKPVAKPAAAAPAKVPAKTPAKMPAKAAPVSEPSVLVGVSSVDESETYLLPITVLRNYNEGGELADHDAGEVIEVRKFQTKPGTISVSLGHSAPYGRFKVGVMVTVPAYVEEFDAATAFASAKAHEYLTGEIEAMAQEFPEGEGDAGAEFSAEPEVTEDAPEVAAPAKRGRKAKEPEVVEESGEMTPDDVRAYDRAQLEQMVTDGSLSENGIDAADFGDDETGNAQLAEAIVAVYWPGQEVEIEAAAEEAGEEGYTEEELMGAAEADIKGIWKQWKELGLLATEYPKGANEKIRKTAATKAILAAQAEASNS